MPKHVAPSGRAGRQPSSAHADLDPDPATTEPGPWGGSSSSGGSEIAGHDHEGWESAEETVRSSDHTALHGQDSSVACSSEMHGWDRGQAAETKQAPLSEDSFSEPESPTSAQGRRRVVYAMIDGVRYEKEFSGHKSDRMKMGHRWESYQNRYVRRKITLLEKQQASDQKVRRRHADEAEAEEEEEEEASVVMTQEQVEEERQLQRLKQVPGGGGNRDRGEVEGGGGGFGIGTVHNGTLFRGSLSLH